MEATERHSMSALDLKAGDIRFEWDPDNRDEVEFARKKFDELKKKNYMFFRMTSKGKKGEAMKAFSKHAERIIAIPAVVGG